MHMYICLYFVALDSLYFTCIIRIEEFLSSVATIMRSRTGALVKRRSIPIVSSKSQFCSFQEGCTTGHPPMLSKTFLSGTSPTSSI